MKKLLFIFFFFTLTLLNAMNINSIKHVYNVKEEINIRVTELKITPKGWLALFKKGSSNEWGEVLRWKWTENTITGNFIFEGLETGEYEARVFYNNSYTVEATAPFTVSNTPKAEIKTKQKIYKINESIWVQANNMFGDAKDWVAIYPKGSSNDWNNVLQWKYLKGKKDIELKFDPLPAGEYDARAFFKNSYKLEANYPFRVENNQISLPMTSVYTTAESIHIKNFKGFQKNRKDWVAFYKKGTDNSWENVLAWKWIDDAIHGYTLIFGTLPVGEYEARGFFNNSYKTEVITPFKVIDFKIDENELLQQAKKHCLGDDNSTRTLLCANDLDHVYILTKRDLHEHTYWGHYQVLLSDNSVNIVSESVVAPYAQWYGLEYRALRKKIANTSIYMIINGINDADEHGWYSFYSKESKELLSLPWYEDKGNIVNIKVLDDGKKLYFERTYRNREEKYKETYDISDPEKMTLINRDIVPMPFEQ